ncbi:MAG: hypothetical protein J5492_00400, partial [Oxalobacter sp.]|nr:hypothetical protein [Oxalobacter sp.]
RLQGQADSKTTIVGVAAGVSVAGEKFNGAGSFAWNDLNTENTAAFVNSTVRANQVSAIANNQANTVAIAGELGFGKGVAAGLALSGNTIDSATAALIQGGSYQAKDNNSTLAVDVDAQNKSDVTAVSFGAQISRESSAWNGTVAVNSGDNNTEAAIETAKTKDAQTGEETEKGSQLADVSAIKVNATDSSTRRAGAGELTWSKDGVAAVGVAIGYSEIGGTSAKSGKEKEILRAEIKGADITTKKSGDANPTIAVNASDTSKLTTAGVGLGIGQGDDNKLNGQGAAAAGVIAKKTTAAITDTKVDTDSAGRKTGSGAAEVTVKSVADNYIGSGGVAAVGSLGRNTIVSAGIGLAINKIGNATAASVSGSKMNINELLVSSDAVSQDVGVAVGFSGSAGKVSLAGSFGYNYINSSATAELKDSTVTSEGNIGVVAKSDELIGNYAGAVSFTAGGDMSAAIGASVAVNEIDGDTAANVSGSTLTAKGNTGKTVALKSQVEDDAIIAHQASLETFDPARLKKARKDTSKTGLVVDASATHAIASDLVTAGVAVSSNGGAAALTFNENYIDGKTEAAVTQTDINKDAVKTVGNDQAVPDVGNKQDVAITASDYTNVGAFEVGFGGSSNVSVGATQNTNNAKRTVTAKLEGKDSAHKAKVNAHDLDVLAVSKQGLSNLGLAGAVAIKGTSAAANILNDTFDTTTRALVTHADIGITDKATVKADNLSRAYLGTYDASFTAMGAALGTGIGIISQTSKVYTDVADTVISDHKPSSVGKATTIDVGATHTVDTGTYFTAVAIAGKGAAGSGTFTNNDFDAEVRASVDKSTLTADTVTVAAREDLYAENYGANISGALFGALGINSTNDTVHDKVYTKVTGSTLEGRKSLSVDAEARRDLRQTVANVSVGSIDIGVNIQHTHINKEITDKDVLSKINEANKSNTDMTDYFAGLDSEGKAKLRKHTEYTIGTGETTDMTGVHTLVTKSTLKADEKAGSVNVSSVERNRVNSRSGSGGVGAGSVVTTISGVDVHHKTDVALDNTDVHGKDVMVQSLLGDNKKHLDGYEAAINAGKTEEEVKDSNPGLYALTGVGNVGLGLAVTPSDAEVKSDGTSGIALKNTGIVGDTVTLSAADVTHKQSYVTSVSVGIAAANLIDSDVSDKSALNIDLLYDQAKTIKANKVFTADAQKMDTAKAYSVGVAASGVGVATNQAEAIDESTVGVAVKGNKLTLDAAQANFSAMNAPSLEYDIDNHGFSIITGFYSGGTAKAVSSAVVDVAAGNTFNVDRLSFKSQIGEKDRTMVSGKIASVSVSGIDFAPDKGLTETQTTSKVTLGGQTYKKDKDGNAQTELTVAATNDISHANKAWLLAPLRVLDFSPNGAAQAHAVSKDKVQATAGGGFVKTADIIAQGSDFADNYASGNGGVAVGLGVASKAISKFDNDAAVTIGGEWKANEIKVSAVQRDELESETFSGHGGAIDVTWVQSDASMNGKSKVDVAEGAKIESGTVAIHAGNQLYTNQSGKYANRVHGVVGAFAGGGVMTADDTAQKTAEVNIGKNAQILTSAQQTYEADTVTHMNNTVLGLTAGFIEGGTARAYTTHTYNNLINVEEGSLLKNTGTYNDGGITLSAHEDLFERVDADAHAAGVIGVAPNSRAFNTTNRTDRITVKGTIDSKRDINLYAGAGINGERSSLRHETVSETYNDSVVPIGWSTNPQAVITSKNQVIVEGKAAGKAVQDINIVADSGTEDGYIESRSACLYSSTESDKKILSQAEGDSRYTSTSDNFARVDAGGLLQAGLNSRFQVSIAGLAVPDGMKIDGKNDAGSYQVSVLDAEGKGFKATVKPDGTMTDVVVDEGHEAMKDIGEHIKAGTMDYANTLATQWKRLNTLLEAYDGKTLDQDQMTAYYGYLQEKQVLEDQMEKLGLMQEVTDEKTKKTQKIPVLAGYKVVYVEMPDELVASGGSINVNSDNFYGEGQLKANGKPGIGVDNQSNAYLKLNQMTLGNDDGGIIYRDTVLDDASGISEINKLNK